MKTLESPQDDHFYMRLAFSEARKAAEKGEVPIGAVLVHQGKVIGRGYNLTRTKKDPTAHAEIVVLQKVAKKVGNERLVGLDLYVTLEPCAMCAGAIVQARIRTLVYGATDPKAGACGSVLKVIPNKKLNHRPIVIKGVGAEECSGLLKEFFKSRR